MVECKDDELTATCVWKNSKQCPYSQVNDNCEDEENKNASTCNNKYYIDNGTKKFCKWTIHGCKGSSPSISVNDSDCK